MRWSRLVLGIVAVGVVASGCGDASPEDRFCDLIRFEIVELGDPMAASSSEQMRTVVEDLEDLFDEWASVAPVGIESEVQEVAGAFELQKAVYEAAGYEPSQVDVGALARAIREVVNGEFRESNQAVTDWLVDNCLFT